jgi:ferritin-like metal-binding protein YciE
MEKMNDLKDLLMHEVQDLYSAEDQIIAALPLMIEKAKNPQLKKALQDHLTVTQRQRSRLDQVQNLLGSGEESPEEKKSLLSRLFKSKQVCRGMHGLIEEGNKVMREDMHPDVMDAAIIGCAQKIEHYEICGYGTARTFARELDREDVAMLLEQTLNEEYSADDLLTQLAVSRINKEAQSASGRPGDKSAGRSSGSRASTQERVRSAEPEMEMASNRRRESATATKTTAAGRGGAAPKSAEASRSTTAANRTTAGSKRSTANVASKKETKSARGGRGSRGDERRR